MADLMLSMDRWPFIRRRALSAMAAHPQCFANLLAGHVGSLKPRATARRRPFARLANDMSIRIMNNLILLALALSLSFPLSAAEYHFT